MTLMSSTTTDDPDDTRDRPEVNDSSPQRRGDLLSGTEGRSLFRFSIPLAFGFVINAVYAWTDMYFVSRLGGSSIAALGFSEQINFVLFTLGSGFGIGTGVVVARRIGESRRTRGSAIATQAMSFMVIYSTLAAVILIAILPELLRALNLGGDVLELTHDYMFVLLFGFPANLITFLANSTIRSSGNTVFPMSVLIISALTNGILDPILIFGYLGLPAMGIEGAALSTVISQVVGAAISLVALYSGRLNIRLFRPSLRIDWSSIATIVKVGIPSSLQTLSVSLSRVAMISLANAFGVSAAAAYTIGLKVDILVFMPIFAYGIAIETLVSQSIGAGRLEKVKKFRSAAIRQLGGFIALVGVAVYFFAEGIARIFTTDPAVIQPTISYLHYAVFGYLFFVVGQAGTRSLSGAGHALRSMLIVAAMLFLIMLPLAWLLSHETALRERGVFLSIAITYAAFALIATLAVRGTAWMKMRI